MVCVLNSDAGCRGTRQMRFDFFGGCAGSVSVYLKRRGASKGTSFVDFTLNPSFSLCTKRRTACRRWCVAPSPALSVGPHEEDPSAQDTTNRAQATAKPLSSFDVDLLFHRSIFTTASGVQTCDNEKFWILCAPLLISCAHLRRGCNINHAEFLTHRPCSFERIF